jgi:hypothetical protein
VIVKSRVRHQVEPGGPDARAAGFGVEFLDMDAGRLALLERLIPGRTTSAVPLEIDEESEGTAPVPRIVPADRDASESAALADEPPPVRSRVTTLSELELFDIDLSSGDGSNALAFGDDDPAPPPPRDPGPLQAARAALAAGDYGEARTLLRGVLEVDSQDRKLRALYHLACGQLALEQRRTAEAIGHFEAAMRYDASLTEAEQALHRLGRAR